MKNIKFFLLILIIGLLFVMPVLKYLQLNTSVMDLGIFISQNFQPWWVDGNILKIGFGHFQPFFLIVSSFYTLFDSPIFLIVFQSCIVILSLVFLPVKKWYYGIVFLLCYAVWYNILFDFHYDHIAIPLMMAFYFALHHKKYTAACFIAAAVALVKEPFGLVTAFMGLYIIVKHKKYFSGLFLILFGFGYFYAATHFVIPFFTPDYQTVGSSSAVFGAGGSIFDIALYPFIHFTEFITDIFTTQKWVYLAVLFGSFGLLVPLLSPLELIPAIPLIGIALLSNLPNYYGYAHHYTAGLIAPFTVAFIYAYEKFFADTGIFENNIFSHISKSAIWIMIIAAHILFSPSPVSRHFWTGTDTNYHYSEYLPVKRNEMIKVAIKKYIPADINVSVSSQNSLNLGYLAGRKYFSPFPGGVCERNIDTYKEKEISEISFIKCTPEPMKKNYIDKDETSEILMHLVNNNKSIIKTKNIFADYIVIDKKRPLYYYDLKITKEAFESILNQIKKWYEIVYEKDGFIILKRVNV